MNIFLSIVACIGAFVGMELIAWFTHKYVMHKFLWILHKDHHTREHAPLEWNDIFAIIFAIPSVILIVKGVPEFGPSFWLGIGILIYGIVYFFLHDILVHNRIPMNVMKHIDNAYFRRVLAAHDDHHDMGHNYGFVFMIDWKTKFPPVDIEKWYSYNAGHHHKNK